MFLTNAHQGNFDGHLEYQGQEKTSPSFSIAKAVYPSANHPFIVL